MPKTQKQIVGQWGEEQASLFLSRQGYDIVDRNYAILKHGQKAGEIDIVAWHKKYHFGKTLCFVEVKTRSYGEGSAERATSQKKKMASFFKAVRKYCVDKQVDIDHTPIQFEQVSVYVDQKAGDAKVTFRKFEIPVD
jgi:putative endonuclease